MVNSIKQKRQFTWNNTFVHILLWGVIFILPYFFTNSEHLFNWYPFLRSLPEMFGFLIVFYLNYFLLIEKLLFKGRTREYFLYNIILIAAAALFMHFGHGWLDSIIPALRPRRRGHRSGMMLMFFIRNSTSLFLILGLSVAFKMTVRWFEVENERKELEKAKSEAELQNLKNQINPHFLLNTLNNIYALIEFNPNKAQEAVVDLSKLLRHMLYENDHTYVSLRQEAEFICNYIDLMRIRLSDNVKLTVDLSYSKTENIAVPPLIFISLIENAFKHGISGDKSSFIDISLKEHPGGKVEFRCSNSYFPKTELDRSGSGIGLELVKKRLELLYPDGYLWETKIEDEIYSTLLIIESKNEVDAT